MMSYEGYMCKSINFVCMCTCSLVPRPRTMVIGLGTRLLCNGIGGRGGKKREGKLFTDVRVGHIWNGIWG